MASFSGISWMSVNEKVFCLSYFEVKLQKPGGPVHQGNLSVYLILCMALTRGSGILGHLMEESDAIKPVLRPHVWNAIFFFQANFTSRVWEETQSCILMSPSISSVREVVVTDSEVRAA